MANKKKKASRKSPKRKAITQSSQERRLTGAEREAYMAGFAWGYEHAVKDYRDELALTSVNGGDEFDATDRMYDRFIELRSRKRLKSWFLGSKFAWTIEG